jgi:succinate dehydrogenase / fumarate reductase cytochrome b subunit
MTASVKKARPEFRNINVFTDLPGYRLPVAGIVSILHRISGFLMFLLLPLVVWMLDKSLSSEYSFAKFKFVFNTGMGGVFFKLVALALIWAYLHHLIAGVRHIRMDMSHDSVTKESGRASAIRVLIGSVALTVILGAKLFGLY